MLYDVTQLPSEVIVKTQIKAGFLARSSLYSPILPEKHQWIL